MNVNNLAFDSPKDQGGKVVVNTKFLATTFMFVDSKDAKPAAGAAKP